MDFYKRIFNHFIFQDQMYLLGIFLYSEKPNNVQSTGEFSLPWYIGNSRKNMIVQVPMTVFKVIENAQEQAT